MAGHEVRVPWRHRTVRAWLPDLLAERDTEAADAAGIRATERARQAVLSADVHTPPEWESLARLLLRAEGVASSYIEGVRAPVPDVALAELVPDAGGDAAAWVAANLRVLDAAIAHAHGDLPLSLDTVNAWHGELLRGHTALRPELVGALRDEQAWIGGATPLDAALVTAPVDALPGLMRDLLAYLQRSDVDPVTQAAVSHAQFEIIHPYADGNGRLGRILVVWVLARRIGVRVLPPVSTRIAADPGGYLAELALFRTGTANSWIRWFADTVTAAAARVSSTMQAVTELQAAWHARLDTAGVRADASARRLLGLLPRYPVLTSATAADIVQVSERAGRTALETLAQAGVLAPLRGARVPSRYKWWYAPDVTALVTAL